MKHAQSLARFYDVELRLEIPFQVTKPHIEPRDLPALSIVFLKDLDIYHDSNTAIEATILIRFY